jgi:hypothetical protein
MPKEKINFNLDTSSPRGWGNPGKDGDACEHGHIINEQDLENLKKEYNLKIDELHFDHRQYKIISLFNETAKDTLTVINSGDGRLYLMDSTILPEGLIWPYFHLCQQRNINLVMLDHNYQIDWNWQRESDIKLLSKLYKNLNETIALSVLGNVLYFINDFKFILDHIRASNDSKLWLLGHCSSANLITKIHDLNEYNDRYHGMVLLNPYWQKNWQNKLKKMQYFSKEINKPLLVIQHEQDPCVCSGKEIAKKIFEDADTEQKKYVGLIGGTDQGSPHFSMGYHGFRDIHDKLIEAFDKFREETNDV